MFPYAMPSPAEANEPSDLHPLFSGPRTKEAHVKLPDSGGDVGFGHTVCYHLHPPQIQSSLPSPFLVTLLPHFSPPSLPLKSCSISRSKTALHRHLPDAEAHGWLSTPTARARVPYTTFAMLADGAAQQPLALPRFRGGPIVAL